MTLLDLLLSLKDFVSICMKTLSLSLLILLKQFITVSVLTNLGTKEEDPFYVRNFFQS